jgi:hypothetical protein
MAVGTTTSGLSERWPTAVGLVVAAVACAAVIAGLDVDDVADEFAPGVATMMGIYLAAYATGKPTSAWLAFVGLVAVAVLVGPLGLDAAVVMTAVLGPLWLWVLARGRARDRPWFAIETLGLVFFGGLTIAAVVVDARLAGSWRASAGSHTASGTPTTSRRTGSSPGRGPSYVPWSTSRSARR